MVLGEGGNLHSALETRIRRVLGYCYTACIAPDHSVKYSPAVTKDCLGCGLCFVLY